MDDFLERVFDKSFVESDRYAELLIKEIPEKKKLDVFIEVYRNKQDGDGQKLRYFFKKLFENLNIEDLKQALEIISDELKKTNDDKLIKYNLQILLPKYWPEIEEVSRIRIENRIIESIDEGKHFEFKKTQEGWLATWASNFFEYFILQEDLIVTLYNKFCSSEKSKHDYVIQYFSSHINKELKNQKFNIQFIVENSLKNGNINVYNYLINKSDSIKKVFKSLLEEFREKDEQEEDENDFNEDDLPF